MHMADALITPAVGLTFTAAAAGIGAYSLRKLRQEDNDERIPLMGVMGAFVFTAQMVNFAIPGTGSSGHLGGGLLLASILGPHAAFLTLSTVLLVQALLFGDGGLLAFGCNLFNLGFFPCYIAWPLLFRPIMGSGASKKRTLIGAVIGAVVGLQAGAFSVVLQTLMSGRTELPFRTFVSLMQPIHLAIGVVEGLVTAAVVLFLYEHRPDVLKNIKGESVFSKRLRKHAVVLIAILSLITGTLFSSFASSNPDGLEWAMLHTSGAEEMTAGGPLHSWIATLQNATALLPDYSIKNREGMASASPIDSGTALSGAVGGIATLMIIALTGFLLRRKGNEPEHSKQ